MPPSSLRGELFGLARQRTTEDHLEESAGERNWKVKADLAKTEKKTRDITSNANIGYHYVTVCAFNRCHFQAKQNLDLLIRGT